MIVQWIWSTTFFKLENPYSLKWLKGSLRHQAGMSSFQNIRNRNRRCALLDGRRMHSKKVYTWRLCRSVFGRVVWSLSIRYSSLSQFVPICFLFERVMSLLNKELERLMNLGPLPSNWFPVDQVMVWCNDRVGTTLLTSLKTNVVVFQRLGTSGAIRWKWLIHLGKFWHTKMIVHHNDRPVLKILTRWKWSFTKMIVWDPQQKYFSIMNVHKFEKWL